MNCEEHLGSPKDDCPACRGTKAFLERRVVNGATQFSKAFDEWGKGQMTLPPEMLDYFTALKRSVHDLERGYA